MRPTRGSNKIITPKIQEAKRLVKAAYYSATSDSPSMDFSFASDVGINDTLAYELNTLRTRIKYELRQNGPAKGLCRVYANACISTGPTLSIETSEGGQDWAEEVEYACAEWMQSCGYIRGESLAELLHVGVRQFFFNGEYFVVNKMAPSSDDTPIRLRLMQINPARVKDPFFIDDKIIQGVEFNNQGRPAFYHIEQDGFNFIRETARNMRHVFYTEEPEQVRGEPWLAAGLPDLHKRRRYDEARVAAAIVAAKFAIFLTQNDPSIATSADDILDEDIININDGAATILPPHMGVESFSGSQPHAGAESFRREMIANAGAGVGMASNASNQDSSNSNFASARYDDVGFGIELKITRDLIINRDLNPLMKLWLQEAQVMLSFPPPPEWYRFVWRWPIVDRHTDPLKASNADKTRLETGIDTYTKIWSEHGESKEQKRQEMLEEIQWFEDNGLRHPMVAQEPAPEPQDPELQEEDTTTEDINNE